MTDKMADVADKALDKVSSAIGEMTEVAKKIAPHAWEIMVRQQIVEGIVNTSLSLLFLLFAALFIKWASKGWAEERTSEDFPVRILSSIIMAAVVFFVVGSNLPEALMKIFNPEYYAIMAVLGK